MPAVEGCRHVSLQRNNKKQHAKHAVHAGQAAELKQANSRSRASTIRMSSIYARTGFPPVRYAQKVAGWWSPSRPGSQACQGDRFSAHLTGTQLISAQQNHQPLGLRQPNWYAPKHHKCSMPLKAAGLPLPPHWTVQHAGMLQRPGVVEEQCKPAPGAEERECAATSVPAFQGEPRLQIGTTPLPPTVQLLISSTVRYPGCPDKQSNRWEELTSQPEALASKHTHPCYRVVKSNHQ